MKVNNKFWIFLIIPLSYLFLYNLSKDYQIILSTEDGIVEYIGAFAYLFASVMFLYLFIKDNHKEHKFFGKSTKRNIYFVLLGLLFLVAFGEEISWGQRIFGWDTPQELKNLNAQNETNIHNLWLFQSHKKDGTTKSFFENMLNANRLLNIFWMLYCVVIPIIYLVSKKGKKLINYLGTPLVPLWIGLFFVLNYIISISLTNANITHNLALDEIKESFYGIGFALLSFHFFKLKSKK